jgi:tetratricopeptide (TPR) repeat protein
VRAWSLALVVVAAACSTITPFDRGLSFAQRGQDLAAKEAFDEAIRRSPESAPAYANRGIVRAHLGDLDGANEDYTKALALGSRDSDVFVNRGLVLIAKRDYQGAITDFTTALSVNPRHAGALFARGSARWLAGDTDQARADWLRAIELEPDPRQKARMLAAVDSAPPVARPAVLTSSPPAPAPAAAPGPGTGPPASAPASTSTPPAQAPLDSRALAARGLERELKGDRPGAITDLRAALAAETDPDRRQGIRNLLQLLDAR